MPNNKHVFVRYPLLFGEGAYLIGDLHMFYKKYFLRYMICRYSFSVLVFFIFLTVFFKEQRF